MILFTANPAKASFIYTRYFAIACDGFRGMNSLCIPLKGWIYHVSDLLKQGLLSRRDILKMAAGATVLAASANYSKSFGQNNDTLRIATIGCGARGAYDTNNCLASVPNVEIVAAGDLFQDRMDTFLEAVKKKHADKVKITPETSFVGWDAWEKVLKTDCDLVLLTTPPQFRPQQFRAAIDAGKHVFMEKPVAVDPVGVRSVIETAGIADAKNLKVAVGTQARKMDHRIELAKRIKDGEIGDILAVKCIRTGGAMRDWGLKERAPEMSDMEWQIRRWLFHTWLSGDFIAEMHIHELDIVSWMLGDVEPEKLRGAGGRQVRTDKDLFGDAFDHYSVTYDYPKDLQVFYMGNQIDGTSDTTFERFYGTKGVAYTDWSGSNITGEKPWKFEGKGNNPVVDQHKQHIEAIRNNTPLNEAARVAHTTLLAIAGRMSAYTSKELKYSWAKKSSKLDLSPEKLDFGAAPAVEIPVPGQTPLV